MYNTSRKTVRDVKTDLGGNIPLVPLMLSLSFLTYIMLSNGVHVKEVDSSLIALIKAAG